MVYRHGCEPDVFARWAAALILSGVACHHSPKLFTGGPPPIGQEVYLQPANYSWSFPARPGETYQIRAEWPPGNVLLKVGSDQRGSTRDEEDDASNSEKREGEPSGAHGQKATWQIGPKANTAFIELHVLGLGRGTDPVLLRIDRGG
jgi:hypothetical protein